MSYEALARIEQNTHDYHNGISENLEEMKEQIKSAGFLKIAIMEPDGEDNEYQTGFLGITDKALDIAIMDVNLSEDIEDYLNTHSVQAILDIEKRLFEFIVQQMELTGNNELGVFSTISIVYPGSVLDRLRLDENGEPTHITFLAHSDVTQFLDRPSDVRHSILMKSFTIFEAAYEFLMKEFAPDAELDL